MTDTPAALPEGCRSLHLAEVDSTNAEGLRRVLVGERGPLWIRADRQTAGRGRSGRAWSSHSGNLFASCVTALSCQPSRAGQLSLVAGVAAIDAIHRAGAGPNLRLKWPNDILVDTAKLGGILVESSSRPPQPGIVAVIGIGLNLVSAPDNLGRSATFLSRHGLVLSPDEALCFLAHTMSDWIKTWDNGEGFAQVREAWLARAGAIGEPLTVNAAQGPVSGTFAGLDDYGALLVDDAEGRQLSFAFGDVTLPPKDANA
ncbi:MAG: biotin--[acetyl-CoA-carboxylase] ligase [Hyphomicrobium sp.]|jgi:BirA family biotin operon repressor/biotin-[acetyl-CoA-carboxylase] ligase